MDQQKLKTLLDVVDEKDRIKLTVLHNATVQGLKNYQAESTAAHLNDYQRAEKALDELIAALWAQHFPDAEALANVAAVLAYLQEMGWRVTKTSLYRHQKEGKIAPRPDGSYGRKETEKYARTWLKQMATGKRLQEKTEDLQRRKLEIEIKNAELDNKRKELTYSREIGAMVPKEQMEIELASRAGVLQATLRHWIQSHAAGWIRLGEGNTAKVGDVVNLMNHELDDHINTYAGPMDYQVVIEAAEENEEQGEG